MSIYKPIALVAEAPQDAEVPIYRLDNIVAREALTLLLKWTRTLLLCVFSLLFVPFSCNSLATIPRERVHRYDMDFSPVIEGMFCSTASL